jgi:hypothetical protein
MEDYEISDVRNRRLRRAPYGDHLENKIGNALLKLEPKEKDFIQWLLMVGRAENTQMFTAGFQQCPKAVEEKTGAL